MLLTFVLQLTIGLVTGHTEPKVTNALLKYSLRGNSTHLKEFTAPGPEIASCNLKLVLFSYTVVNRPDLVNFFQNCQNITRMTFHKVAWEWSEQSSHDTIYLPNLRIFEFELLNDKKWSWRTAGHLESIVCFHKSSIRQTGLRELLSLDNFKVAGNTTEGSIEFEKTKTLAVKGMRDPAVWSLLFGIWSAFSAFGCRECVLTTPKINMENMTDVVLTSSEIVGGTLTDIFRTARVVKMLGIFNMTDTELSWVPRNSLKRFYATHVNFCGIFKDYVSTQFSKAEKQTTSADNTSRKTNSANITENGVQNLRCALIGVVFSSVKVCRSTLVSFLQNCHNLTSIILGKTTWIMDTPFAQVYLPRLVYYRFWIHESLCWKSAAELESVVFFYTNNMHPNHGFSELLNDNVYIRIGGNTSEGELQLATKQIVATKIKDAAIWSLLRILVPNCEHFAATFCLIHPKRLVFSSATTIVLQDNEIVGGDIADVVKSAKIVEVLNVSSVDVEAIDVALLPSNTLTEFNARGLSFRWSSTGGPVHFPNLESLMLQNGDVNLKLFGVSSSFEKLTLYSMDFWDCQVDDISQMGNLSFLFIACVYHKGNCPEVLLDSLPSSLEMLILNNVVLKPGKNQTTDVLGLSLAWSTGDESILRNLNIYFRNLVYIKLNIQDISGDVFQQLLTLPQLWVIHVLLDTFPVPSRKIKRQFEMDVLKYLNITLHLNYTLSSTNIVFKKVEVYWSFNIEERPFHHEYRASELLQLIGVSEDTITHEVLQITTIAYLTVVYTFCSVGLIGNIMSAAVLCQKAMRGSTTRLLVALAFCDSLYLLTTFFAAEEFKLMFLIGHFRSSFNTYVAYPLNKTAYTASVYMTILITIERFAAIWFPLHAKQIFSISKTTRYSICMFVFAVILNQPRWYEFIKWKYAVDSKYWSSYFPRQLSNFPLYIAVYQKGLWYFFSYAVPVFTIAILNLLSCIQLKRAARRRCRLNPGMSSTRSQNSLTRVLLTVVTVFFVCNSLSATILWILISKNVDPAVAEIFSAIPIVFNSAVNFVLYYSMGTRFRTQFMILLRSCWNFIFQKRIERGRIGENIALEQLR